MLIASNKTASDMLKQQLETIAVIGRSNVSFNSYTKIDVGSIMGIFRTGAFTQIKFRGVSRIRSTKQNRFRAILST